MSSEETFNWPDVDVILRATHGAESRDFRVHKSFLSFSSPVFKDMFKIPQPSSASSDGVDVVDVTDPPRALELVLRFIYPSDGSPVIVDLSLLSEVWVIADKYDIEVARSRLRSSLREFATTEPLRTYAIACRLGLEDEMKLASSHTTSIHLPGLAELSDEFKFIPATEYHRLILLHSRCRKMVADIAGRSSSPTHPTVSCVALVLAIAEGIPLNHESLAPFVRLGNNPNTVSQKDFESKISSILSQASALKMTI